MVTFASRPRVVFFGTSAFAVPLLRALAGVAEVICIVTQPDRPSGRGHRLTATPVKEAAVALGLEVRTPEKLRPEVEALAALRPDALVVASYGRILPASLLAIAPLGALNVHPSALPLYRGAQPIARPIADGRGKTAASIMLMDAGLDTGDIVLQRPIDIGAAETGGELHDRLAELSAPLLIEALAALATGTATRTPQAGLRPAEEIAATFTRPLGGDDLLIDWSWPACRIADFVRAYAPRPGAKARLAEQQVKVLECSAAQGRAGAPGTILDRTDELLVGCGDGAIVVARLVPPGRPAQTGAEFLRRFRMESGV